MSHHSAASSSSGRGGGNNSSSSSNLSGGYDGGGRTRAGSGNGIGYGVRSSSRNSFCSSPRSGSGRGDINEVKVRPQRGFDASYGDYDDDQGEDGDVGEDDDDDWDDEAVDIVDDLVGMDDLGIDDEDFWEVSTFPKGRSGAGRPARGANQAYGAAASSSSSSCYFTNSSARRSRRMKPLDVSKELIVLMPGDDPVDKLGLDESELPEFICCMEEACVWEEPENLQDKDHGGHKDVEVPEGTQVIVPDVTVVEDPAREARATLGKEKDKDKDRLKRAASHARGKGNFVLGRMGESVAGTSYTSYEIESDDEDFLAQLRARDSKVAVAKTGSGGRNVVKPIGVDSKVAASFEDEHFCNMLVALEREFELARSFAPGRAETDAARARCVECMETSTRMLELVDATGMTPVKTLDRLERLLQEKDEQSTLAPASGLMTRAGHPGAGASPRAFGDVDALETGSDHGKPPGGQGGRPLHEQEIPCFSRDQVEALLPLAKALPVLVRVYNASQAAGGTESSSSNSSSSSTDRSSSGGGGSSSSGGDGGTLGRADSEAEDQQALTLTLTEPLLQRVHAYWAQKRASRKASLLRCYHTYIMENWTQQKDVLPVLPEDMDPAALLSAHDQLSRLRRDLDRARLIMDRVRRREKLKRDLVRTAGDALSAYVDELPVVEDGPEEPPRSLTMALSRQPRAAKQLAVEKLAGRGSREPLRDDLDFDENVLPFSLEDVNYDLLELPSPPSPAQLHVGAASASRRNSFDEFCYNESQRGSMRSRRFVQQPSPMGNSAATGWTGDEDHLLLLGVAACGVGRWTEIREDFLLARNSAQMNQRFTRLARRRCVLVKITGNSSAAAAKRAALKAEDSEDDDGEYTEVRTAFMTQHEIAAARSKLPPILVEMLEKYTEDGVWESIALRHLFDTQSKEKRCGRPQKYPLPIPIPKHLQNGGWQSRKRSLVQRPSTLVPGWQPGAGGGYGVRVGSFHASPSPYPLHIAVTAYQPSAPTRKGRPRKYSRLDNDEDDDEDDDAAWEVHALVRRKKEEQDTMRSERAKARALVPVEGIAVSHGGLAPGSSAQHLWSEGKTKRRRGRPPKQQSDENDEAPRKSHFRNKS